MSHGALHLLLGLAVLVALLVWAVYTVDVTVLRWWAAGATLLALPLWILGYVQGKADSHALRAGIQTGVSTVMSAAAATAASAAIASSAFFVAGSEISPCPTKTLLLPSLTT